MWQRNSVVCPGLRGDALPRAGTIRRTVTIKIWPAPVSIGRIGTRTRLEPKLICPERKQICHHDSSVGIGASKLVLQLVVYDSRPTLSALTQNKS